jgi:phospho-N-acetylmuramoyl-pentapeptide-transferase
MLIYLFEYLDRIGFPGAGVFQYISFRSASAVITSLIISLMFGKSIINYLHKKQIGESVRDLGLKGQIEKQGTPTMGGIIILASILIPVLLFADLANIYIQLMLVTTVWLGLVGFTDDYIKVFKKNKKGLTGKFKILGQVMLGIFVGLTLYLNDDVIVREKVLLENGEPRMEIIQETGEEATTSTFITRDVKSTRTTIPFVKNNEFDYAYLIGFMRDKAGKWAWAVLVIAVIIIITAVSNGANMTDGLDGLATGTSAIM